MKTIKVEHQIEVICKESKENGMISAYIPEIDTYFSAMSDDAVIKKAKAMFSMWVNFMKKENENKK